MTCVIKKSKRVRKMSRRQYDELQEYNNFNNDNDREK